MQPGDGRGAVTCLARGAGPTTRVTRGERARGRAFDLTWMGFEPAVGRPFGIGGLSWEDGFGGPDECVQAV